MDTPRQEDGGLKSPKSESSLGSDPLRIVNNINRRQSTPVIVLSSLSSDPERRKSTHSVHFPCPVSDNDETFSVPVNKFNRRCSMPDDPYNVEYSRAVNQLGLGKFHWSLAFTCGFMFLAAGLENNLNAYILSSVHCDLHISSSQMGLLNAVFLAGGISSNFLWGVIADMLGRRTVLVYGMFFDGIITLCASLSQGYVVLLVFRFFSGFIVGGPSALVFAYMGEFFPDRVRPRVICYVGVFWTLSWVIMPGMAWLIIPLQWSLSYDGFVFNSWRLLIALTSLPSLLSAALLLLFPESPRFVLVQGKGLQAVGILSRIYAINHNRDSEDYPVRSLQEHVVTGPNVSDPKSVCRPITVLIRQGQLLFASPTIRITALASFLFFSNMFGYYGLGLWLPEMFNRMSSHKGLYPDTRVTLCSAGHDLPVNTTLLDSPCDPTSVDPAIFTNSVIMGAIGLLGNIISGVLSGRLERNTLPVILMALSATCIVVIYFTSDMNLNLILASSFQLTVGTANLVYNSLVVDMFPPNISGMGVCVAILSGRLGGMISNLVFGHLLDVFCPAPVFLVAAVLLAGSLMSCLIPKKPYTERIPSASFKKIKQEIFVVT